ncbi:MAG: LysR family transcriptional regulator [Lachnospiraceae bacterium]|nr:LysR family transcriptional regulator [Lachnospiraceae bacterium]
MKIENLMTIQMVAKTKSLKDAAEAIPCSYSTVTKQVKAVEDELGIRIFDRHSRNKEVTLTEAGEKTLKYVDIIVRQFENLKKEVSPKADIESKRKMSISINGNLLGSVAISNIYTECYIEHPDVELKLEITDEGKSREMLSNDEIDAALAVIAERDGKIIVPELDDGYKATLIGDVPLEFVTSIDDDRWNSKSCTLSDIKDEKFLFAVDLDELKRDWNEKSPYDMNANFIGAFLDKGIEPRVSKIDIPLYNISFADLKANFMFSHRGTSYSLVPESVRDKSKLKYLRIKDIPYFARYYLIFKKENPNIEAIEEIAISLQKMFNMRK